MQYTEGILNRSTMSKRQQTVGKRHPVFCWSENSKAASFEDNERMCHGITCGLHQSGYQFKLRASNTASEIHSIFLSCWIKELTPRYDSQWDPLSLLSHSLPTIGTSVAQFTSAMAINPNTAAYYLKTKSEYLKLDPRYNQRGSRLIRNDIRSATGHKQKGCLKSAIFRRLWRNVWYGHKVHHTKLSPEWIASQFLSGKLPRALLSRFIQYSLGARLRHDSQRTQPTAPLFHLLHKTSAQVAQFLLAMATTKTRHIDNIRNQKSNRRGSRLIRNEIQSAIGHELQSCIKSAIFRRLWRYVWCDQVVRHTNSRQSG